MKAIIQRVSRASVIIDGKIYNSINSGLVVFLGISAKDNSDIISWICNKIANLRIFNDSNDKMNLSIKDIGGEILIISNFTLYGDVRKGFRPGFTDAAPPKIAEPIYKRFLDYFRTNYSLTVKDGIFGARMDIELINSGPVTIELTKEI